MLGVIVMKRKMPAIAYIFYDWAISPLPTLHTTFIFSIFFVQAIAPNEILGNVWWSWMIAACSLTIAIVSRYLIDQSFVCFVQYKASWLTGLSAGRWL